MNLKSFIENPANGPECNRHKLCKQHPRSMLTVNQHREIERIQKLNQ